MPEPALIVAKKEIMECLRDTRSVASSAVHALLGPAVVLFVYLVTRHAGRPGSQAEVVFGMASIFLLVAGFIGGMNVAMDAIAGERERRSLVPLLINPLTRFDVVLGKWLATSAFAAGGVVITVIGFAPTLALAGFSATPGAAGRIFVAALLGMLSLAFLAAAIQVSISVACRSPKEAQTYLSFLVFLPMFIGFFLVFVPKAAGRWCAVLPVAGQQLLLGRCLRGEEASILSALVLAWSTLALAVLIVLHSARMLQRERVVLGN